MNIEQQQEKSYWIDISCKTAKGISEDAAEQNFTKEAIAFGARAIKESATPEEAVEKILLEYVEVCNIEAVEQ